MRHRHRRKQEKTNWLSHLDMFVWIRIEVIAPQAKEAAPAAVAHVAEAPAATANLAKPSSVANKRASGVIEKKDSLDGGNEAVAKATPVLKKRASITMDKKDMLDAVSSASEEQQPALKKEPTPASGMSRTSFKTEKVQRVVRSSNGFL